MHFDLNLSIDMLRRSPATLRALLDGLGEPWVRAAVLIPRRPTMDEMRHGCYM